tara:strand:+ start:40 stop:210 length:171 start_codon:yes stop_codon:yes gene_type:complete
MTFISLQDHPPVKKEKRVVDSHSDEVLSEDGDRADGRVAGEGGYAYGDEVDSVVGT